MGDFKFTTRPERRDFRMLAVVDRHSEVADGSLDFHGHGASTMDDDWGTTSIYGNLHMIPLLTIINHIIAIY